MSNQEKMSFAQWFLVLQSIGSTHSIFVIDPAGWLDDYERGLTPEEAFNNDQIGSHFNTQGANKC